MTDAQIRAMVATDLAERIQAEPAPKHASWPTILSGGFVVWLLAMALFNIPIWGQ